MNEFEKELIGLLNDMRNQLALINEKIDEAVSRSRETRSELINSVFGLLQQPEDDTDNR